MLYCTTVRCYVLQQQNMSQLSAKKCNLTEVVEKAFCVVFFVFPYPKINQDARRAENTWERKQVVEQGEDLIASDTSFK